MEHPDTCRWTAPCEGMVGRTALARTGERLAAEHLEVVHGLHLLALNHRVAIEGIRGELDVLLRDFRSGLLVVCEVKARTGAGGAGAVEALSAAQRHHIRRLTGALLASGLVSARGVRFDLVTVDVPRDPGDRPAVLHHHPGAW